MAEPARTPLEAVAAARWRIAVVLTAAMMVIYFGFILLVAFNKALLGVRVADGLSLGMLLGALVILAAWVLTWMIVGGVIYTLGAIVYMTKIFNFKPGVFGFHEVWHIFVLLAAAAHFVAVLGLAIC